MIAMRLDPTTIMKPDIMRSHSYWHSYVLRLITVSHFSAMFVAFSIPPFLATILAGNFENGSSFLGLCYAAPVLAAFAGYPVRTKLTTYLGEKKALLASYIAVSVIMLMMSMVQTPEMFLLGLILQGAFAPTFATSSSYLACWMQGEKLVTGVSALQVITRIAAVAGPSILGMAIIHFESSLQVYLVLSVFSLFTAVGLAFYLPQGNGPSKAEPVNNGTTSRPALSVLFKPYLAQILLLFSITVSAPHFIAYLQSDVKSIPGWLLGLVFAIPSLAYLCCVPFLSAVKKITVFAVLCTGFLLVAVGFAMQWLGQSWLVVTLSQIIIGIGTFIAFTGINVYLVRTSKAIGTTKAFFRFELTGRCAMAMGAIVGDMSVSIAGLKTPFLISGTTMTLSLLWVFFNYSRH